MRALAVLVLAWLASSAWAGDAMVTLHYQARPPYSSDDGGGQVTGLVATPAARALAEAGIPFQWARTPSQRQIALIQSGRGLHCGIGWFRNAAREARGKFSDALYRDQPYAALARASLRLPDVVSARDLLADRRWHLLVKEGYSYGSVLDDLIAQARARVIVTSAEPRAMGQMLRSGRADWMIAAPEEAAALADARLRLLALQGMPPGQTRHLYCSGDLPDDWLARINAALARAAAPPPTR